MAEKQFPNKVRLTPGTVEEVRKQGVRSTSKVRIRMPAQHDDKDVFLTVMDEVDIKSLKGYEKFKPGRSIANIKLEKDTKIDPPVSLIIEITQEDVDRAKKVLAETFTIGYHDSKTQEWVVIKDNIPRQVGEIEVDFAVVGDPPIAIAP
jgi:hypothetical protein